MTNIQCVNKRNYLCKDSFRCCAKYGVAINRTRPCSDG